MLFTYPPCGLACPSRGRSLSERHIINPTEAVKRPSPDIHKSAFNDLRVCERGSRGRTRFSHTAFAAVLPSGCAASRRQSTARTPRFLSVARSSSLISNGPSRSLLRYRERLRRPRASGPPRRPDPRAVGPRRCVVVATGDTTWASSRWSRPAGRSSTSTPRPTPSSTRSATTSSTTDRIPFASSSSSTTRPRRSSPRTSATRTATRSAATRVSSRGRFAGSTAQLSVLPKQRNQLN